MSSFHSRLQNFDKFDSSLATDKWSSQMNTHVHIQREIYSIPDAGTWNESSLHWTDATTTQLIRVSATVGDAPVSRWPVTADLQLYKLTRCRSRTRPITMWYANAVGHVTSASCFRCHCQVVSSAHNTTIRPTGRARTRSRPPVVSEMIRVRYVWRRQRGAQRVEAPRWILKVISNMISFWTSVLKHALVHVV